MSCITLYMRELEELFYKTYKSESSSYQNIVMEKKYGKCSYTFYSDKDINFGKSSFFLNSDTKIISSAQDTLFFITIIYSGSAYIKHHEHDLAIDFSQNRAYIGYQGINEGVDSLITKKQQFDSFSFFMTRKQLQDFLIEYDDVSLIKEVETIQHTAIIKEIAFSLKTRFIIQKLLQNPYHGILKDVYDKSLIYELLLSLLKDFCPKTPKTLFLSDDDKAILYKAKKILLSDLQNPPTIEALSKMVPMNQSKLKTGFKLLFGNTIHKTLTEERMSIAHQKLHNNDMSVWEIAHEAGYENVSNFIRVFRNQYGKTPGQIRKEKKFFIR
ncbi:MAG: AraC family transcriptional regulator [Epsilonproteobacteria bacterium]|nr:AraC family transcriptional regulator [Campylobacterota bacterium]